MVRPKFPFGSYVHFESPTQGRCGSGAIFAVIIAANGVATYIIDEGMADDVSDLQPGILEDEIHWLSNSGVETLDALSVQTRFIFGDHVHFSSLMQKRVGSGTVVAITVDLYGVFDYMIDPGGGLDIVAGFREHEIWQE